MIFELPTTGTGDAPVFLTAAHCAEWLKELPLSNPVQAQAMLLSQTRLLVGYSLPADVCLSILETLREPSLFIQGEVAKKFSGRPLPLAPQERSAFDASHGLWEALANSYLRCLNACMIGDARIRGQAALICQRALSLLCDDYAAHVQAGLLPESESWSRPHAVYAVAETQGVATATVGDGARGFKATTPAAAYAEIMLLAAAGLHELMPRHRAWVMRWARMWAGKIRILAAAPPIDSPALPLCVDLESQAPAGFRPLTGPGARWLETSELRKSLKKRLTLLAKGDPADTPARLGLGEDCTQPACGEVLKRTYPRWVKGGVTRRQERHPMSGACRFVVGVDAIHYYLSGHEPFKSPVASSEEMRRQREEIAVFGRVGARFEDEYSRQHGYRLESWEIIEDWGLLDRSSGGLRLVRPLDQEGGRVGIGQLVAVQPAGGSGLLLGMVRWSQVTGSQLVAGILLMPGKALPVAIRGTGVMASRDPTFKPGFLLPPIEALQLPASVILPPGSFKQDRIMEAWNEGQSSRIKVKTLLERGVDFEHAGIELLPDK